VADRPATNKAITIKITLIFLSPEMVWGVHRRCHHGGWAALVHGAPVRWRFLLLRRFGHVVVPLLSRIAVPVVRLLASRNVVWFWFCADAAVIMASVSAAMVIVFIVSFSSGSAA
jgi:hypothetical protein